MPQRTQRMSNDAANFTLATVTGVSAWLTAEQLAIIVPCLWALYVLMLIAKTLPEVWDKHPWIGRLASGALRGIRCITRALRRLWRGGV